MTTVDEYSPTVSTQQLPIVAVDQEIEDDTPRLIGRASRDDIFTVVGAVAGSFALMWLFYYEVLPLSGLPGFVVSWYFGFLALYAGVTALEQPRAIVVDRLMGAIVGGIAGLVGLVLLTVVVYTVYRGRSPLAHWNFYTQPASAGPLIGPFQRGGISNAIIGSLIEVGIAIVLAMPLGIGTAVFLTEVGSGWFARAVRTVVEAMTAVPDLLAGLFVYVFLIIELHGHRNGLAVSIALAVTGTPIIARSAEVSLRVVPGGLREAGLALGSSQWQTVWRVVLPTARPGLATALILAIARMIGESAPLLIVSGFSTYWESNPFDSNNMNSLPLYIYECIRQGTGQKAELARGFGAAVVLLVVVFVLFMLTRVLARQRVGRQ